MAQGWVRFAQAIRRVAVFGGEGKQRVEGCVLSFLGVCDIWFVCVGWMRGSSAHTCRTFTRL